MNTNKFFFSFFFLSLFLFLIPSSYCVSAPSKIVFLIQDKWGGIQGITHDIHTNQTFYSTVRQNINENPFPYFMDLEVHQNGGYMLDATGKVIPIGHARLPYAFRSIRDATSFIILPNEKGGWIAGGKTVKPIGRPPMFLFPSLPQDAFFTDMEYDRLQQRIILLCSNGFIAECTEKKPRWSQLVSLQNDRAIDIEWTDTGFLILTENGKVYQWTPHSIQTISDVPNLGKGLACDIETSPTGQGFYLLDLFGVIHACDGAPYVPTEPFLQAAAVDLEIYPGDEAPTWNPPGLHTQVGWETESVLVDPLGPTKSLAISIDKAENLTGFSARIRFDPHLLVLDPGHVRVGSWWGKGLPESRIKPVLDHENGILTLQGAGTFFQFDGISGSGELARLGIAAVKGVTEATTVLEIEEFSYWDAMIGNPDRECPVINSCTVQIAPILPKLELAWVKSSGEWFHVAEQKAKSGEIIRADILVTNGSRIRSFEFDLYFTPDQLKFLGMTQGNVWHDDIPLQLNFDIPSKANRNGFITKQSLTASRPGACQDKKDSLVNMFFVIRSPGQGEISIQNIHGFDDNRNDINMQVFQRKVRVISQ